MAKFVIWVVFDIKPGAFQAFMDAVTLNARASVRDEPGCHQFDILIDEDGGEERIALYEIYDDVAAFEAHLQTPHFAVFKDATEDLVSGQDVKRYNLVG